LIYYFLEKIDSDLIYFYWRLAAFAKSHISDESNKFAL